MPMVRLYSAEDAMEAHLLKHMLEQQEIGVFITGEHLEGVAGELPVSGLVDVWVVDSQLADAREVLEDFFDTLDGPDDELMDEDGYYLDDADGANDEQDPPPAHDDPDNPWNRPYRKRDKN